VSESHVAQGDRIVKSQLRRIILAAFCVLPLGGTQAQPVAASADSSFALVVLPDTQNATDYTHQKTEGFALDSADIFMEQMRDIARRGTANGGNVAFVAAVGDVWQHLSSAMDPEHEARGVRSIENPILGLEEDIQPEPTRNFEIPTAIAGYRLLSEAGIPFGVAPGNHDYDAIWSVAGYVPSDKAPGTRSRTVADLGLAHVGGLASFRSAFGSDTDFFRDKDWYVGGYQGGGSSAQIFSAGGYRFLHFAFEMQAGDDVLAWAQGIIDQNPGLPTLISTHDYLNRAGERMPDAITDLALGDPAGNNHAQEIWEDFISANDQILMVFSGHQLGQATRIDDNQFGHKVYQMLSDYQGRGQAGVDAGQPLLGNGQPTGIGDGWYRELTFHLDREMPTVDVRTWSSHYKVYSSELESYAQWYKGIEQPEMSDAEFLAADEFTLTLDDFHARFGEPGAR
jgi:hypothetical protein